MSTDPYQTLGISPAATLAEARTAYLKRVRVLHPDRFDPASQKAEWELANQMLQELNDAWASIEAKGNPASDQKTTPAVPRPQSTTYSKPPAPVSRTKNEAGPAFDRPITFSRVTGEPGPFSGQAVASFAFILMGALLSFSLAAFLAFILAIILARTAKASIRRNEYRGLWLAHVSLWAGYLGLIGLAVSRLLTPHSPAPTPLSPLPDARQQQIERLNNELAQLDEEQRREIELSDNNPDAVVTLLQLQVTASQAKIAEQAKVLAELKQKDALLKNATKNAVNTTPATGLPKEMADLEVQIAGIESELKNDNASLSEQLTLLHQPKAEQMRQIDAQISAQFEERRRSLKEKLSQLGETVNPNP